MAVVLQKLSQNYHYVIDELSGICLTFVSFFMYVRHCSLMASLAQEIVDNHRTRSWWLMEGPGPVLTILASYLFFCSYAGPQFMKDRKPYKLKTVLMVYNLLQIALSVFLSIRSLEFIFRTSYSFRCYEVDYSDTPEGIYWAGSVWWYFFAKITELLDTVFFVLRKKNNQVSFLHLYHHTLMPMLAWFGTKYTAGGQAIPEGGLNSFIHVLMYGYYFMAGLGPQYQKYLWWKKYLTTLQLIQFSIVLYLNLCSLLDPHCGYPKWLSVFVITNCLAFLYMFGMFYYRSYVNNGRKQRTEDRQIDGLKKDS